MQNNLALSGICQYHRDTLPPQAILSALQTHKGIRVNETLMRLNPHYQRSFLIDDQGAHGLGALQLDVMLDPLSD